MIGKVRPFFARSVHSVRVSSLKPAAAGVPRTLGASRARGFDTLSEAVRSDSLDEGEDDLELPSAGVEIFGSSRGLIVFSDEDEEKDPRERNLDRRGGVTGK